MPTPVKPLSLVKKHLTIAEKKARMRNEAELMTGSAMQEWPEVRANAIAHKRFTKTKNLLASTGKDDAMLEPVINRYCMIHAECYDMAVRRQSLDQDIDALMDRQGDMDFLDYLNVKNQLGSMLLKCDAALQTKRKMLLDIEKENGMTLLSQIRATVKKTKAERPDDSGAMFG